MAGNDAILAGVASILQQASAALAHLQSDNGRQPQLNFQQPQQASSAQSIAGAAAALAQVAAQVGGGGLGGGFGGGLRGGQPQAPSHVNLVPARQLHGPSQVHYGTRRSSAPSNEPIMTTQEFISRSGCESWVAEALDLLVPQQRAAVMNAELNISRVRNVNGMVMSRLKQAVPLDQRLGIFVQINGLSEGVVDRISTLTPEQAEALLDTGYKIMRADNPSGVAMRRITDAIRSCRGKGSGKGAPSRGRERDAPADAPPWQARSRVDRSRTPGAAASDTPEDVEEFVRQHRLEWWCGEVLKRLSLWQRQQIMRDLSNLEGARNPSGVVMSKVKTVIDVSELVSIFIDLNSIERSMEERLMELTPEQQANVIAPGIYLQNVRNPNTAVRSRINNVLSGNDAFGKPLDRD